MKEAKLTLVYSSFWEWDIKEYLLTVHGIKDVSISFNNKKDILNISYNSDETNYKLILKEIELFAGKDSTHYLISFDKHISNVKTYNYENAYICCEYCLEDMIKELYINENVNSYKSDFNEKCPSSFNIIFSYTDNLDDIINIIQHA